MTMTEKKPFQAEDLETEVCDTGQDTAPEEQNEENETLESLSEQALETPEDTLKKEVGDLKDQLLRALAEAENTRKRAQKDREEATQYAITNFARDMLSVQDNLQRALESAQNGEDESKGLSEETQKALLEGVTMTAQGLSSTLEKHGIKEVSPLHTPFDSNFHQAMFEEETDDHAPGIVTKVLQTGYTLKERLLRPAMVGVSKKKS